MSCLQYKNIIVDKNQSFPYFPPHCGIQCSIPSKVCPLRKRLPLSCHKNSSQIFDATKLWKHTIPLTYNTKTIISNRSETHRFSPQMRLIAYPDHKTTHKIMLGKGVLQVPDTGTQVLDNTRPILHSSIVSGCHQHVLKNVNITFLDNTGTPEMFQYLPILGRSSIWDPKYTFPNAD